MNRAEILIEDDGIAANVRFVFKGGFDNSSPAHQMANIIRVILDEEFKPVGEMEASPQLPLELEPANENTRILVS